MVATVLLPVGLTAQTVAPLMEGYCWTQLAPYNDQCPYVGNTRCATGCVATAMAQILHYHHWAEGRGEVNYMVKATGQQLTMQFEGETYNLDALSPDGRLSADKGELARFNYHVGASVCMQWGPEESSSYGYAVPAGLWHFGYANEAIYLSRSWFGDDEWNGILRNELNHARPVLYTADNGSSSHAFILDGTDGKGRYHVIWGWGTDTDGWYALDNLEPAGHKAFSINQGAVINIAPHIDREKDGVTCYNALQATRLGLPSGLPDTTMTTGDKMTFTASYIFNFNQLRGRGGKFGILIEDSEGNLIRRLSPSRSYGFYTHLSQSDYYGLYAYNAWTQHPDYTLRVPFEVTPDMPDGTYRISLYFTPDYDPTQYSPVRCKKPKPYWVEVHVRDAQLGIGTVTAGDGKEGEVICDLLGRPVDGNNVTPGIYIRGKKKIWIR